MTTEQVTPQPMPQAMTEAMDQAIALTAKLFGLPEETVRSIVEVGLPMMAQAAIDDPNALDQLHATSRALTSEPLPEFYRRLGDPAQAQQTLQKNFANLYGPQAPALTRDVARRSGASEEQAGQGLAGTMPGMAFGLGKSNPQQSQAAFAEHLARVIARESGVTPQRTGTTQDEEGLVLLWAYFETLDGAATALTGLQDSPQARLIHVENTAVIEKDADGTVALSEREDRSGRQGLKRGAVLGGLLGVIIAPLAILPAAAAAAGAGSVIDRLRDTGFDDDQLRQAAEEMAPNSSALVTLIDPENANGVKVNMASRAKRVRNIALSKKGVDLLQRLRD
jgi:uncharacterized membrane protein